MCFLAMVLGSAVSCQQAEELVPTLASLSGYSDDNLYSVTVNADGITATISSYSKNQKDTNVVIPSTITYNNKVYTVTGLFEVGATTDKNKDITSITLPSTLKMIGGLGRLKKITSIDIPESVDSIRVGTFKNSYFTHINIPSKVTTIPIYAFYSSTSLESIALPSELKKIDGYAFYGCSALNEVNFPSNLSEIAYSAFNGCRNLKTIVLPESLTKLGEYFNTDYGTGKGYTFAYCTSLTSIVIPSKISAIRKGLFAECTQLQHVTLGAGVKTIEEDVFRNCTNLKTLYVCAPEPPTLEANDIFSTTNYNNCTLYVPEGSVDAYKGADYWKNFTNIVGGIPTVPETGELKTNFTDAKPTIAVGTYEVGNLTYSRTVSNYKQGIYGTFCLPFSINLADSECFSDVYIPNEIALYNPTNKKLTLMMSKASKTAIISAGQPFMAKLNSSTISLKNYISTYIRSTVAEDLKSNMEKKFKVYDYDGTSTVLLSNDDIDVRFCGTFSKMTDLNEENYKTFSTTGMFYQDKTVNPFRAYIYKATTTAANSLQSLTVGSDAVTDAILNGNYTIKSNQLIINK